MNTYVEHMQLLVSDLDKTALFYTMLFPDWKVRGQGHEVGGSKKYSWIHIGNQKTYLSFRTKYDGTIEEHPSVEKISNHIGIVVSDIEKTISFLQENGYQAIISRHPHRIRVYTRDPDGYEIEVVQYLSEHDSERNDYLWCLKNGITQAIALS